MPMPTPALPGFSRLQRPLRGVMLIVALAFILIAVFFPQGIATAQASLEGRVSKLEQEMRAVQRQVFGNTSNRFFEPEIGTTVANPTAPATAKSDALTPEILARLDSLETSLMRLNARVEEQDAEMAAMAKRLSALEEKPAPVDTPTPAPAVVTPAPAAKSDPARIAAVAKIERPKTGNAFEDGYNYGYRLWEAKFYPEAQAALKSTADAFPTHPRISFARNLLGRAYLDDQKPGLSVDIFLNNYQEDPRGERAPDSLVYLAVALTRMNEKDKACVVLKEFVDVYPQIAVGRLSRQYGDAKARAECK